MLKRSPTWPAVPAQRSFEPAVFGLLALAAAVHARERRRLGAEGDAALRHPAAQAEHGLLLGTAALFGRPVRGREPLPDPRPDPLPLLYLALASHPVYDTHLRLGRPLGPPVLDDQGLGGGLMWVAGDLTVLVAVVALVAVAAPRGAASVAAEDGAGSRHQRRMIWSSAMAANRRVT